MTDHINLFQTEAEFNAAYNGEGYVEPWVSYTMETSGIAYNKEVGPTPPVHDYSQDYLTLVMLENGTDVCASYDEILLSTNNGETWSNEVITGLSAGDKVLVKSNRPVFQGSTEVFSINKNFNVEGNIMSLSYGDNFRNQTALPPFDQEHEFGEFVGLFYGCATLISAENLILLATALTESCYEKMFYGCTGLTTAPTLPATTLADYCYSEMFRDCYSLTTAPVLPATTLAIRCYRNMFMYCASLNYIKCLATDVSATDCTKDWLKEVASSGTFVKNPSMISWTIGYKGIPSGWAVQDAS